MHSDITGIAIFLSGFLILCAVLHALSERSSAFPYTSLLVVAGFATQGFLHLIGAELPFTLSPDFIYFILLPILLFESAFHINIHQFRLQFRTISFLATFGLLISVLTVAVLLTWLAGLPFGISLLFGAIISSTDPIAVIALFKQLGAPKRLALVADGESMFNDATGVIAFRVVLGFLMAGATFQVSSVAHNIGMFLYVFVGSMVVGAVAGYLAAKALPHARKNRIAEATLTLAFALFTFTAAERFLHLSGVITAVAASIMMGNFGRTKMRAASVHFMEHLLEYLAFTCVSLVFFFASVSLDVRIFVSILPLLPALIIAVLCGRAVSVYLSCSITNRSAFFRMEPNIPLPWQHVLNWGGLRGVIPLVLAFSLPADFAYRDLLISCTMAIFLFTLIVNGAMVRPLLVALGLHFPPRVERLYHNKSELVALEEKRQDLSNLPPYEFDRTLVHDFSQALRVKEERLIAEIESNAGQEEIFRSLRLAGNAVERYHTTVLFERGYMDESVLFEFESQLDRQQDRLEYPDLPRRDIVKSADIVETSTSWRRRLAAVMGISPEMPWFKHLFKGKEHDIVLRRLSLLQVRLITSEEAVKFFTRLRDIMQNATIVRDALDAVLVEQRSYIAKNKAEMGWLCKQYPALSAVHQRNILTSIVGTPEAV